MPPGIGHINPQILMRLLQQQQGGQGPPLTPITPQRITQGIERGAPPQAQQQPGGFSGFMQKPGVIDMLLSTGSALLAQSDQPGSLGGALGRALPVGMQALQQGQQNAALDEVFKDAPPEMQQLVRGLPLAAKAQMALQMMQRQAPEPVVVGAGDRLVDRTTGNVLLGTEIDTDYSYHMVGDNTIAVMSNGQLVDQFSFEGAEDVDFSDVSSLRKEFEGSIGEIDDAVAAYSKVVEAGTGDQTPAKDIALVFNYMKTIDPGSIVRESEFATAQNAAGVPAIVRNIWNRVLEGTRLGVDQRREFVASARGQLASQVPVYEGRRDFYRSIAERNRFNVDDVIRDPFEGVELGGGRPDPLGIRGGG
jgi:hypothetical protein